MIRGDFCDLTEEQLNDLETGGSNNVFQLYEHHGKTDGLWEQWVAENRKEFEEACDKDSEECGSPLYSSLHFRKQCVEAGFRLKSLYPCYYQGWECDEWGGTGTKDGKHYCLETSHGGLNPVEIEFSKIEKVVMKVLKFIGVGE